MKTGHTFGDCPHTPPPASSSLRPARRCVPIGRKPLYNVPAPSRVNHPNGPEQRLREIRVPATSIPGGSGRGAVRDEKDAAGGRLEQVDRSGIA